MDALVGFVFVLAFVVREVFFFADDFFFADVVFPETAAPFLCRCVCAGSVRERERSRMVI